MGLGAGGSLGVQGLPGDSIDKPRFHWKGKKGRKNTEEALCPQVWLPSRTTNQMTESGLSREGMVGVPWNPVEGALLHPQQLGGLLFLLRPVGSGNSFGKQHSI